MPKKFFKRHMPDAHKVRHHKHLRFLGTLLHDPNLWHLNRRSVSGAVALGLFMAFMPIPLQMIPAAALAIVLHFNLPITTALVWVCNPITLPPMFYFSYKLGSLMLGRMPEDVHFSPSWDWLSWEWVSWEWLWETVDEIGQPYLLGSFTLAIISALLSWLLVQGLWRLSVTRDWNKRKKSRQARTS